VGTGAVLINITTSSTAYTGQGIPQNVDGANGAIANVYQKKNNNNKNKYKKKKDNNDNS
jgi:hypothetical protein